VECSAATQKGRSFAQTLLRGSDFGLQKDLGTRLYNSYATEAAASPSHMHYRFKLHLQNFSIKLNGMAQAAFTVAFVGLETGTLKCHKSS